VVKIHITVNRTTSYVLTQQQVVSIDIQFKQLKQENKRH